MMKKEFGIEIPYAELAQYFGGQILYMLLKLRPQYPAQRIVEKVSAWQDVESVDEVYGDVDMVIRARTDYSRDDIVTKIRTEFGNAIENLSVLITD